MTEDEVRTLADEVLAPILGPAGFVSSDVQARPDHAGDDSLYVIAHFKRGAALASGKTYLDAQVGLWNALLGRGEDRFPYVKYDYGDDEAWDEEESEGAWVLP